MTAKPAVPVCAGCGTRLARDNTGRWCGACTRDARTGADGPPVVPLGF